MGVLDKLFGNVSGSKPAEEEIDMDKYLSGVYIDEDEGLTRVEVMKLSSREDVPYIVDELKKNNIIILDITPMIRDSGAMADIVSELKDVCFKINGDIGRISNTQVIVVPEGMRVRKG
ncbi:MAG: hypothetical protein CVT90_02015 [Candidatus Altiarchaeales archaeon HGW-Altiarchaeales-3]|nr:MAG: hypothetical protein CVT90_02015 [Candidatus Altiarchaeales archaeon HGW-Altiarchaeales-3]